MRIERLEFVSAFEKDETILLTAGREIKRLQTELESAVIQLNVPGGAPPELPRIVIQAKGFVLNICQNRFQFLLSPPDHISGSYAETREYLSEIVRPRLKSLFLCGVDYLWSGLIQTVNFPADLEQAPTAMDAVTPAIRQLVRLDWPAETLASFSLKVGRSNEGFYHTFQVSGYATRLLEIEVSPGQNTIEVGPDQGSLEETGIQVVVDVNNRPSSGTGDPLGDFDGVGAEHMKTFEEMPRVLGLTEII